MKSFPDDLLREMEHGLTYRLNFDKVSENFSYYAIRQKLLREQGGCFYERRLGGENSADIENRLRTFFADIYREQERYGTNIFIIVAHSFTNRVFTKAWCKKSVEWFDGEEPPANCSIRLLEKYEDRGYIYEGG